MRFMNGWKQTDRRGMGRTAGPKLVRAGACRMIMAWLLLFLMIGLSARGAEGKEMSSGSDTDKNNLAWWQRVNAYEIYVNSFQDSDGDGYGDLNGRTESASGWTIWRSWVWAPFGSRRSTNLPWWTMAMTWRITIRSTRVMGPWRTWTV